MKIAIIGAGAMAKIIAVRAKELHIETLCFAWNNGALAKDFVDQFYDISIFEKEKIACICKKEKIIGVLATTELTVYVASYIANELKLNCNPLFVSQNITKKSWVRRKTENLSIIHHPAYQHLLLTDDFNVVNVTKYPVIVKPVSAGGKKGISVVYSEQDLLSALNFAGTSVSNKDGLIVEEYLNGGREFSVESLSFHKKHYIIQITEKESSGAPHCVELAHHQPASLSDTMRKKVIDGIEELLVCVGIENGPCHTEIKIIDNQIYLIEVNGRPGGDHISYPLTELSTGYKFITGIILTACDIFYDPDIYKGKSMYAGIYFVSKQTAYLKKVFDTCDDKTWLYKKNFVTKELQEITHNDGNNLNYFMYYLEEKPSFLKEFSNFHE